MVLTLRVLQPGFLTTRGLTSRSAAYKQGFLHTRVLQPRVLTVNGLTPGTSYNQGSYIYGF